MAELRESVTVRRRFKSVEPDEQNVVSEDQTEAPVPSARINRHSVFWICAAAAVTYWVDFFPVILYNNDINSWWFAVALVLLSLCVALAVWCVVYLEWFRGIRQYEQEFPAIPAVTTATFIAASCSLNVALWPVWSFFTPLILFTQFMGLVMIISLLG